MQSRRSTFKKATRKSASLVVAAMVLIIATQLLQATPSEQKQADETRQSLQKQNYKTDLSQFNFSVKEGNHNLQDLIGPKPAGIVRSGRFAFPMLMEPLNPHTVGVVWKQDLFETTEGIKPWPSNSEIKANAVSMDLGAATKVILDDRIRFNLNASAGSGMLLPHLSQMKGLSQSLTMESLRALRGNDTDRAWTNFLAATRLATAWDVEPVEISLLVRAALVDTDYESTWQLLQFPGWKESQLVVLQKEWEQLNLFTNLEDVIEFAGACAVNICQQERQQPLRAAATMSQLMQMTIRSPQNAWGMLKAEWQESDYKAHGSYVDEKDLMLFYRDRADETKKASEASTWLEMENLPGVTNMVLFKSKYSSRMQTMLNLRNINTAMARRGGGFMGRIAEAETRRRIIITAIALERYRMKHNEYPKSLDELAPDFERELPVSFVDGKPLRYHLNHDGRYWMYSPGLDGIDHGGEMASKKRAGMEGEYAFPIAPRGISANNRDIVWPMPATEKEAGDSLLREKMAQLKKLERQMELQDADWWSNTRKRQSQVEEILRHGSTSHGTEAKFHGVPVSVTLNNDNLPGTNKLTINQMLTLTQILTGEEPEKMTFEFPMKYEALTNIGTLSLLVDPVEDTEFEGGCGALMTDLQRATNGNCRLVWNTIFEPPGKHALQAGIVFNTNPNEDVFGPLASFTVSNLCQFSATSANFDTEWGSALHAKLNESNAKFVIEMKSTTGEVLKTITGKTGDGYIREFWDLVQENGQRFKGDYFDTVFHITLTDSGKTQTLKGP